jgi:hypothetical protein
MTDNDYGTVRRTRAKRTSQVARDVVLLVALLLAAAAIVVNAQDQPRRLPYADLSHEALVTAAAVGRLADSLRVAEDGLTRYCSTRGAPAYVRRSCVEVVNIRRSLEALYATRFALAREGPAIWSSSMIPVAGVDTITVCGVIHYWDHSERLVWPPVRVRALGDSAAWSRRGGNPLTLMCAAAFPGLSPRDSVPVEWSAGWTVIDGRRLYRPSFRAPPE